MKKILKWIAIIIVTPIFSAFLYGFVSAMFEPTDELKEAKVKNNEVKHPQKPFIPKNSATSNLNLPINLNDEQSGVWLIEHGVLDIQNNHVKFDKTFYQQLSVKDAMTLYKGFLNSPNQRLFEAVRLLYFSLCAFLPENQRRAFASQSGAVLNTEINLSGRPGYIGDFVRLFYMYDAEINREIYAHAIQKYSQILTNKEMVLALKQYGAYYEDKGGDGDWNLRVKEKMSHYDSTTLLAIHHAIDDEWLGHNRYLKAELLELAELNKNTQ